MEHHAIGHAPLAPLIPLTITTHFPLLLDYFSGGWSLRSRDNCFDDAPPVCTLAKTRRLERCNGVFKGISLKRLNT